MNGEIVDDDVGTTFYFLRNSVVLCVGDGSKGGDDESSCELHFRYGSLKGKRNVLRKRESTKEGKKRAGKFDGRGESQEVLFICLLILYWNVYF